MKPLLVLAVIALLLAQAPALAQERDRAGLQRQELAPRERPRADRELRRERMERGERQQRFTREERDKLRQDLLDANRDLTRRRR